MSLRFAFVLSLLAAPAVGQDLTEASFSEWREYLEPSAEEVAWRAIPWRDDYGEALADAQREDKPVLLWAMNGHPLGCV